LTIIVVVSNNVANWKNPKRHFLSVCWLSLLRR